MKPGVTVMRAGTSTLSIFTRSPWEFVYAYQWGGLAKAIALGKMFRDRCIF